MAARRARATAAQDAACRICRHSTPGVPTLQRFPQADGRTGASRRPQLYVRLHPNTGYRRLRKNLSRPGGNVTGIFVRQLELASKRVEIAREAFPRATLVGIAFDTVSHEQRD